MGYYNEEKVLYFAAQTKHLHVGPDESKRGTTLHGLVTDLVKRGLLEQHSANQGHRWYRTTKAGDIRLLTLQIAWRQEHDKDTQELRGQLAILQGDHDAN